eukprot:15481645-Alexandrium_andersonii.AAC.1
MPRATTTRPASRDTSCSPSCSRRARTARTSGVRAATSGPSRPSSSPEVRGRAGRHGAGPGQRARPPSAQAQAAARVAPSYS